MTPIELIACTAAGFLLRDLVRVLALSLISTFRYPLRSDDDPSLSAIVRAAIGFW